jgi:hypothetical protein
MLAAALLAGSLIACATASVAPKVRPVCAQAPDATDDCRLPLGAETGDLSSVRVWATPIQDCGPAPEDDAPRQRRDNLEAYRLLCVAANERAKRSRSTIRRIEDVLPYDDAKMLASGTHAYTVLNLMEARHLVWSRRDGALDRIRETFQDALATDHDQDLTCGILGAANALRRITGNLMTPPEPECVDRMDRRR